uniref:Senescence associated protein n=1 Tax=Oryza sativa subsp. japonica TaxID=39947 RepID=I7HGY1_ORYSJ|nr:senescence associated protein [Oryza sativa Japonica Group]
MNAWLPQASYPCGNFSNPSAFKLQRSKGSIGHAFTVLILTGNQNQPRNIPLVHGVGAKAPLQRLNWAPLTKSRKFLEPRAQSMIWLTLSPILRL